MLCGLDAHHHHGVERVGDAVASENDLLRVVWVCVETGVEVGEGRARRVASDFTSQVSNKGQRCWL